MTNQQQMPTEKVIERIKKLLALADKNKNSSAAEAESAAAKVQELLQDYGLSLAQVTASERNADAMTDREKAETDRRAMYKWQRELMAALAKGNFCIHFVQEKLVERTLKSRRHLGLKKSTFHVLIGRTINIQGTIALYDYLVKSIGREAARHGYDHGTSDNALFFDGAVSRLSERLFAQRAKREREEAEAEAARRKATAATGSATPGTGLVLLSDVYGSEEDLNADLRYGLPAGTTAARRKGREASERERRLVAERLESEGVDWVEAFYRSHGYSEEDAKKAAREYYKKNARENAKNAKKGEAFSVGRVAGDKIGLDLQVEKK